MNENEIDEDYLGNYKINTIYTIPGDAGGYVKIVGDCDVSSTIRIVVEAFYVNKKDDITSFKLVKIQKKNDKWVRKEHVTLSNFNLAKIKNFLEIISSLDLDTMRHEKLSLEKELDTESLIDILNTEKGSQALKLIPRFVCSWS